VSDEEIDILEDIESFSPSIQNMDFTINAIAVLHVISGILAIPTIIILFSLGIFQAPVIVVMMLLFDGAMLITSVPLYFILGWAIWSIQPWAWKVSVITNIAFLVLNLLGALILPALLNIVYLFALNSIDVRLALAPIDDENH
jgi:hypothetical protein